MLKTHLESGEILVTLEDITELKQESQILQATYDQFVDVTVSLQNALDTIEEQKRLLQEQKDILDNELQIAHNVQSRLFQTDFDRFQKANVYGSYQVMSELGGDMWEFYESDEGFLMVLGDVMGHGVDSSLISIAAKHIFKKKFESFYANGTTLASMCEDINNEVMEITGSRHYITVCLLSLRGREMEYMTCGHPPMILTPADSQKDMQYLITEQPMLGVFENEPYTSKKCQVEPGDRIFLYTDCLTDSMNPEGKTLEIQQIFPLLKSDKNKTAQDVIRDVLGFRQEYSHSDQLPDDLALVCVEIPS